MQLHKRDVVEAATSLLDDYGIADLSMRRLARELEGLARRAVLAFRQQTAASRRGRRPDPGARGHRRSAAGDWRDRIAGTCGQLRDALLSHTDGAELVSASFAAGQSEVMSDVLARLSTAATEAGVAPAQRGTGRPHGRLLRAGVHRRRTVPAAVGRGGRRAATCGPSGPRIRAPGSLSACACSSTGSPPKLSMCSKKRRNFEHKFSFESAMTDPRCRLIARGSTRLIAAGQPNRRACVQGDESARMSP